MATTNLGLELQAAGSNIGTWGTDNNSNFQKIDDFLTLKRCKVYANAVQAIPNSSATAIDFAAETYDTDNMHDNVTNNSRITIASAGFYIIKGQLMWAGGIGGRRIIFLWRNGDEIARVEGSGAIEAGSVPTQFIATDYYCNASDYIQLIAYHTKGTDQNTHADGVITSYLMAVRVGF